MIPLYMGTIRGPFDSEGFSPLGSLHLASVEMLLHKNENRGGRGGWVGGGGVSHTSKTQRRPMKGGHLTKFQPGWCISCE